MPHLLTWPKRRQLMPADGHGWLAEIAPGRLTLTRPVDGLRVTFTDTAELRAFAMQVYAAAIELDLEARYPPGRGRAGAKAARRRAARPRMETAA